MNDILVQVSFASTFLKALKKLKKRYPQIRKDLEPLIE